MFPVYSDRKSLFLQSELCFSHCRAKWCVSAKEVEQEKIPKQLSGPESHTRILRLQRTRVWVHVCLYRLTTMHAHRHICIVHTKNMWHLGNKPLYFTQKAAICVWRASLLGDRYPIKQIEIKTGGKKEPIIKRIIAYPKCSLKKKQSCCCLAQRIN